MPPGAVATVQSLAGLVTLAAIAFVVEGAPAPARWTMASWGALLYLALAASVVALWLNSWLLRRMDTSAMLLMGWPKFRSPSHVMAFHIQEMRSTLLAAYSAASRTPPSFTDPTFVTGGTVIRASHIAELRAAVVALE